MVPWLYRLNIDSLFEVELCTLLFPLQDWESTLKAKHLEDMQSQMLAHKAAIDSIQQQAMHAKHTELAQLADKHKLALGGWCTPSRHMQNSHSSLTNTN